ncbi:MAG TPA: CBS domain-containing protein [Vicinamibacterales bacterium]|nr:CBS domain-containing protein [Vicinamibacterales bacterium]
MRVNELMTSQVRVVAPSLSAREAWDIMRRDRIHHLLVADGGGLLGILSDKDAGGPNGAAVRDTATVGDLMTRQAVTIDANATVRRAANLMRGRTIGCLPVTDGGRTVGIVTVSDLLALLGHGVDRPARPARAALHFRVPHRRQKSATGRW